MVNIDSTPAIVSKNNKHRNKSLIESVKCAPRIGPINKIKLIFLIEFSFVGKQIHSKKSVDKDKDKHKHGEGAHIFKRLSNST